MADKRSESRDLSRLAAAIFLYYQQQRDRVVFAGSDEYEEVVRENGEVVRKVLPILEQTLDEDLLDQLDDVSRSISSSLAFTAPWLSPLRYWRGMTSQAPLSPWFPYSIPPLSRSRRRSEIQLEEIVDDFKADLLSKIRDAQREDRDLSDSDLDDLLKTLRSEISDVDSRRTTKKKKEPKSGKEEEPKSGKKD